MSPEQAEGRLDRLSPASDVYSLGAMLYTLLCGCLPFEYAWCEVTTLLARVKNGEFAPPRQVNPRVPKPLEAVCLKAMAKGPEDRYVSAEDLAVDIELSRVNLANREFLDDNAGLAEELLYGCPSNLRNWEWSHVQRLAHLELDTSVNADTPQRQDVWSLAFSPDGRRLVSGSGPWYLPQSSATAALEVDSGREVFKQRGWNGAVQAVAFSPDGQRVVAGTGTTGAVTGAVLTCHDAATGKTLWRAEEHAINILSLAYSPDGKTVASGCGGFNNYAAIGYARLRDAATGKVIGQVPGGPGGVASVAFSPDGNQLALASRGMVDVWDLASHKQIISCSEDRGLRLWDVASGRSLASFHGHTGFVHCVAFSPDGAQAASGGMDGSIKLWPAAAPDTQVMFRNGSGWVGTAAFHPGGHRFATAHNGDIRVWDPRTGEELWHIVGPRGLLGRIGLAFSPDGQFLIASAPDGALNLWNAETGTLVRRLAHSRSPIGDAAPSPDGSLLATAGGDGAVVLWILATGTPARPLTGHAAAVNAVAFSPDGLRLATASDDLKVKVWDVASGSVLMTLSGHATGVRDVAFSPDGRFLASVGGQYRGTPGSEVMIWDASKGSLFRSLEGHTGLVTAVAYFPDGSRLATASDDRTIKLWDPKTGDDVFTLRGHTSGVVSLAISRDGRQVVSGSIDCTTRIWSAEPSAIEVVQVRRRAAVELVQSLFETHMLKSDVMTALPWLIRPPAPVTRKRWASFTRSRAWSTSDHDHDRDHDRGQYRPGALS